MACYLTMVHSMFGCSLDTQLIFEEDGDDYPITLQNVLNDDVWIDDMS